MDSYYHEKFKLQQHNTRFDKDMAENMYMGTMEKDLSREISDLDVGQQSKLVEKKE